MTAKRQSLIEYAQSAPRPKAGNQPWLETIPEFEEVCEAYRSRVPLSVIVAWLNAPAPDGCGYSKDVATRNKVERYLREKVER